MSAAGGLDWGSVADWVSGVGSIVAAGVALYLSGAEHRARRDSERPTASCDMPSEASDEEWVALVLELRNPGSKRWLLTAAELLSPKGGVIVWDQHAIVTDDYGGGVFSAEQRDAHAAVKISLPIELRVSGSLQSWGSGRLDVAYVRLLVKRPPGASPALGVRLHLKSLEPVPDSFTIDIRR
jgi:hypothetical protein